MPSNLIAITDHSAKGLPIVQGLTLEKFEQQQREIAQVNDESSVCVLRSVEMNLRPDGEGDVDPETLRTLDIVLGSFHSKLPRQRRPDRAVPRSSVESVPAHPGTSAWAHLQLPSRPRRRLAARCDAGTYISIGTDARHPCGRAARTHPQPDDARRTANLAHGAPARGLAGQVLRRLRLDTFL